MTDEYSTKKTKTKTMREAGKLNFNVGDIHAFVNKADRLYKKKRFNAQP